jgi:beta-1,4-mannosyl-glycoprotein beta-1,4-N-acetylglucosaminyltransferase
MKKVIDCFMFFNEFDLLEGRLKYLNNNVDYFVLVESNLTHSGQLKPLHFAENLVRYRQYLDKILYFPLIGNTNSFDFNKLPSWERDYDTGPWQQENAQRNHIAKALNLFDDQDIIMISDLDEIPHKDCVEIAKDYFLKGWDRLGVRQDHYCYNFNQKQLTPWIGTSISTNAVAKKETPQQLRNSRHGFGIIENGGWHLTYWGTVEDIQYKIDSFAHQELNLTQFKTPEHIKEKILKGEDMFNRNNPYIKVDSEKEIPKDIRDIFGVFEQKNLSSINV